MKSLHLGTRRIQFTDDSFREEFFLFNFQEVFWGINESNVLPGWVSSGKESFFFRPTWIFDIYAVNMDDDLIISPNSQIALKNLTFETDAAFLNEDGTQCPKSKN